MSTLRLLLTGSDGATEHLLAAMMSVEGVTRAEEIDPLLPQLDDSDSSSLGLAADGLQKMHVVEVDAPNTEVAQRAQSAAELTARAHGAVLEIDGDAPR